MIKLYNDNLVGVGFFFCVGGNIVPIDRVKYLWLPLLSLDYFGAKSISVGCKADLLLDGGGDNSDVNDEVGRQRG